MMDGGDYAREPKPTLERMAATLLVVAWVITAFHIGGLPLAIRATVLFLFPCCSSGCPEFWCGLPERGPARGWTSECR